MNILKPYFDTEGPFGLPMKDKQAKALEARLRDLPKDDAFSLRRCSLERGITEVLPEGRSEVSWITAETPDRTGDVVIAAGMDDAHFQLNPIVTLNHAYDRPPVGRSLWRRKVREGALAGVKAKTVYPSRPARWSGAWPPDEAFELIQAGLLCGKSIGFFPLKLRPPSADEIAASAMMKNVRYVIEQWLLVEYACCVLPMQPHAVVAEITQNAAGGLAQPSERPLTGAGAEPLSRKRQEVQLEVCDSGMSTVANLPTSFLTFAEIAKSLPAQVLSADVGKRLEKALQRSWEKTRGRV